MLTEPHLLTLCNGVLFIDITLKMTDEPSAFYRSFQGYKHFQHSFIAVLHDF